MVQLDQNEYKIVSPTTVQLNVIANLIIEPADTYILRGDVIYYKLLQVRVNYAVISFITVAGTCL